MNSTTSCKELRLSPKKRLGVTGRVGHGPDSMAVRASSICCMQVAARRELEEADAAAAKLNAQLVEAHAGADAQSAAASAAKVGPDALFH